MILFSNLKSRKTRDSFFIFKVGWNTLEAHRVYACSKRWSPWNSGQVEVTRLFRTEQGGLSRGSCSGGL